MRSPWSSSLSLRGRVLTAAVVLIVVAIGTQVGSALASLRPASATATVTLALQPDALVSGDPSRTMTAGSIDDGSFLQRELVYLGGPELERAVRQQTGVESTLTATQVEKSSVVALSATAASTQQALRADTAAQSIYADRRRRIAINRLNTQAKQTQLQIVAVRKSLDAATANAGVGGNDAQTTALESRYANLLALAGSIEFVRQTVGDGVAVIQASTIPSLSGVSRSVLGAGFGALVGLLLCLGALVLWRRMDPRITSAAELAESGAEVISPVTPRMGSGWPGQLVTIAERIPTRLDRSIGLQSAQLLPERDHSVTRGLILVGVTQGVGSSSLAAQHAAALARRRPTLLICAADVVGSNLAVLLGGDPTGPGVADLQDVVGTVSPDEVRSIATASSVPGLSLLAAGSGGTVQGLELLAERGLVRAARDAGWDVVVDAPALSLSPVATAFARDADALALAACLGVSRPEDVDGAMRVLDAAGVVSSGVLLHYSEGGRSPRQAARAGGGAAGVTAPQANVRNDERPRGARRATPTDPGTRQAARSAP